MLTIKPSKPLVVSVIFLSLVGATTLFAATAFGSKGNSPPLTSDPTSPKQDNDSPLTVPLSPPLRETGRGHELHESTSEPKANLRKEQTEHTPPPATLLPAAIFTPDPVSLPADPPVTAPRQDDDQGTNGAEPNDPTDHDQQGLPLTLPLTGPNDHGHSRSDKGHNPPGRDASGSGQPRS